MISKQVSSSGNTTHFKRTISSIPAEDILSQSIFWLLVALGFNLGLRRQVAMDRSMEKMKGQNYMVRSWAGLTTLTSSKN